MILLYNLAIRLYVFAIRVASWTGNKKAALWIDGRKHWREKVNGALAKNEKRVWFHCSSLGEFEQGRPLIEKLIIKNEKLKIVLTFFSPSGYEVRKNYKGADYVFYLPADTKRNAADFISLINPEMVFFTKYEYWHHFFFQLKKKGIPLYMISAIFRPGDRFFAWYGAFFRKMLSCVNHFFLQDERSLELLSRIGFVNATVAGDTRFDRVVENSGQVKSMPAAEKFSAAGNVLVAGSTWPADEKIIAGAMKSFAGRLKIILAPHEINKSRIGEVMEAFSGYSVLPVSDATNQGEADVLLIDHIGSLSSLYKYGRYAYVGGGFGKGVHNTLEAAVYGIPVVFGPQFSKFNEARELILCGGGYSIDSAADLKSWLEEMETEEDLRRRSGKAGWDYVRKNSGATDKILNFLSL